MTPAERSLHVQIADDLRAAIRGGVLPPGAKLPSEHELQERYGVGRNSVRSALDLLQSEGLTRSSRGLGTFVREAPTLRLAFSRFARGLREPGRGPWESAAARAGVTDAETRMVGVVMEPAPSDVAAHLEVEEGAPAVRRSRHMTGGGQVLQMQDAWYPLSVVEGTELAEPIKVIDGVLAALERAGLYPATASEEVAARLPTPDEADVLQLDRGVPVLTVTRVLRDRSGRPLEVLYVVASAESATFSYTDLPVA